MAGVSQLFRILGSLFLVWNEMTNMVHQIATVLLFGVCFLAGLVAFMIVAYWLYFRAPHTALPTAGSVGR